MSFLLGLEQYTSMYVTNTGPLGSVHVSAVRPWHTGSLVVSSHAVFLSSFLRWPLDNVAGTPFRNAISDSVYVDHYGDASMAVLVFVDLTNTSSAFPN
jgi:hypothetical protein